MGTSVDLCTAELLSGPAKDCLGLLKVGNWFSRTFIVSWILPSSTSHLLWSAVFTTKSYGGKWSIAIASWV